MAVTRTHALSPVEPQHPIAAHDDHPHADTVAAVLDIARRASAIQPDAEKALRGGTGPMTGVSPRDCATVLVEYYRLRGELAELAVCDGPAAALSRELDKALVCHQWLLHQAAMSALPGGARTCRCADLEAPTSLEVVDGCLRQVQDQLLDELNEMQDLSWGAS